MKSINLKSSQHWLTLFAVMCLPFVTPSAALAQTDEGGYYGEEKPEGPGEKTPPVARNPFGIIKTPRAAPETTESITNAIAAGYAHCERARRPEYLVDCLGVQLELIAKSMSNSGDYREARKILDDASKQLRALAAANASPTLPRARVSGQINGKAVTSKPLTPVRQDRIKQVNLGAAKIMEEAETKLLRSAASSDRRLIAYAQMANAVGSNKTLLRSA